MIYIAGSYEYENNDFVMKEIYVSDEENMYVLTKDDGFVPFQTKGHVVDVVDATKNAVYPLVGFSEVRTHVDDDPKSFAVFLYNKLKDIDFSSSESDKSLFHIISNFGESYV